jgi:hypothetical protein
MMSSSFRIRKIVIWACITILASYCSIAHAGPVYNAANDFSISNGNPNGTWTYGYSAPIISAPLNVFTTPVNAYLGDPDVILWHTPTVGDGSVPAAFKNTSSAPNAFLTVRLQPGQLAEHPGPNGEIAVVRWTAPVGGTYTINATFTGVDIGGTTTDVHVLHNGASLVDRFIFGYLDSRSYSSTLFLAVGDTIDFTVGRGPDGTYFNDSTALDATITADNPTPAVPEPSSFSLLAIGLASFGYFAVRIRRSTRLAI